MKDFVNVSDYVKQTAELINLNIAPEYLPGVVEHFTQIAAIATLVTEFDLSEDIESAAAFARCEFNY